MNISQLPIKVRNMLQESNWKHFFDKNRLSRGHQIFRSNAAKFTGAEVSEGENYYFDFVVTGTFNYETSIHLDKNYQFGVDCSCPDIGQCKHVAAAFYSLQKRSFAGLPQAAVQAHLATKARPGNSLEEWVNNLGDSLHETSKSRHPSDQDYFEPKYKDRVIYIIKKQQYHPYSDQLVAKKGRLLKDGSYSLQHTGITNNLSLYSKPKYLTPLDFEILMEISESGRHGNYKVEKGAIFFQAIIEKCGLTNRLCIQADGYQEKFYPFKYSAPRVLTPNWQANKKGLLKPSVSIHPPITSYIESSPKIFIDLDNNELGVLEQSHPDAFVEKWLQGPTLKPEELDKVEGLIKKIQPVKTADEQPQSDLSPPAPQVPVPPKQNLLSGAQPRPLLTIERRDISPQGNIFINGLFLDVVIGKVSFYYEEHLIPSGKVSKHFSSEENNIITTRIKFYLLYWEFIENTYTTGAFIAVKKIGSS
jgi:hypothetical protein